MTVKEYLSQAHNIELKINRMKNEIEEYKILANSIPGCNFDQVRTSGTKNTDAPFVKWVLKQIEKEHEIEQMEQRLIQVKSEILLTIENLENSNHRMVLVYRYLEWLSWDEIANKIYASRSTVFRWHERALDEIRLSIK